MLSILTNPINGTNPFGENINHDIDFGQLKAEVGKPGNIDFELVESLSLKLLQEKSKDVRLFSFLSICYLRKELWISFADVFEGLAQLVEKDYDALYPDRESAKQMAFKWLSEVRYVDLLAQKKPQTSNYEDIVRLKASLLKIKPVLAGKFPDGSPFPSNLFTTVESWERLCKPKAPEVQPAQATQPLQAQSNGAAPTSAGPSLTIEQMDTPKTAQMAVRKAAIFMIDKEPMRPMGYRLLRSSRWDLLDVIPPNENGKTQLPGPNPQQRTFFQNQISQKNWKAILEKGEAAFASGANHLWLDLQRYGAVACSELGKEYADVQKAILTETALLLKRVSGITSLAFSDATPFCEDSTKDWILQDVSKILSSESGTASNNNSNVVDPIEIEQQTINSLVSAGKFDDALEFVQKSIRNSGQERDNFRRMIMVGSLLIKAKQPDIAVSVLEGLDSKIEECRIDSWEPDLAVDAWSVLVQAMRIAKSSKSQPMQIVMQEKQNLILSKLSRIDPRKAFLLNKQS